MNHHRRDYPPVGHPVDYLSGLIAVILLIVAVLVIAGIVSMVLPA